MFDLSGGSSHLHLHQGEGGSNADYRTTTRRIPSTERWQITSHPIIPRFLSLAFVNWLNCHLEWVRPLPKHHLLCDGLQTESLTMNRFAGIYLLDNTRRCVRNTTLTTPETGKLAAKNDSPPILTRQTKPWLRKYLGRDFGIEERLCLTLDHVSPASVDGAIVRFVSLLAYKGKGLRKSGEGLHIRKLFCYFMLPNSSVLLSPWGQSECHSSGNGKMLKIWVSSEKSSQVWFS